MQSYLVQPIKCLNVNITAEKKKNNLQSMHKIVPKPSAEDETWFSVEFVSDDDEEEEEEEEEEKE